ncbi:ROK family protein [Henriciella sp.]|uniref:ROK family protein n=1 Tax=Henriciella sp. TaxID=1968823 RepID=UPI002630F26F|nr:ROK family protein [Henriciella sp.]
MLAAIESGGTKFVCALAETPERVLHRVEIPTTTPDETFARVREVFAAYQGITALGIAAFGPVDIDPASPTHGEVLVTSKPNWQGASYVEAFASLGVPMKIESDVSGACLGEWAHGAGQNAPVVAYVTVGTGIGAGVVHEGRILNGIGHFEMGHIPVVRPDGDTAKSTCPIHDDCLEGLASGPSIMARWGKPLSELARDHEAVDLEARYLAQLARTITLTHMPSRIIFGGGVMKTSGLIDAVRHHTRAGLGGYVAQTRTGDLSDVILPAALGDNAGITGALMLAQQALTG